MIDLTPLDVRKKRGDFRRNLRGYDPEEVDGFLDLVAERFEELVKENLSHSDRLQRLESQIRTLEGREKAVQEALVMAQKLRDDVQDQSRKEADTFRNHAAREVQLLRAEAEAEIARHLREAEGMIQERHRAVEELERSRRKFLKTFRSLLERELDAVEVEESREPLEEAPLELEFRGWTPTSEAFFIQTRTEEPSDEAPATLPEPRTVDVSEILQDPEAGSEWSAVEELEAGSEWSATDDPEAGSEWSAAEESEAPEDATPDGFQTQTLQAGDGAWLEEQGEEHGGEEEGEESGAESLGEEGEEGVDMGQEDAEPREPKWLFSLLKDEERKRSEDGAE